MMETSQASGTPGADDAGECCLVCSLLQKGFSTRSYADQILIMEKGRPQPLLAKLTCKVKSYTRYFNADLYEHRAWLTGCDTLGKLFCWPCLLCVSESGVWNKSGFCDLNNLHKVIKRHARSKTHLQAVIEEKLLQKSCVEHVDDPQMKISHRKHNEIVEKNRAVFQRLIDVVCFLGEHEWGSGSHNGSLACTSKDHFMDLVCFLSKYDAPLKSHLDESSGFHGTSDRVRRNLISALAAVILQHIKSEMNKTRFIAIISYETTDFSNNSRPSLVARYMVDGTVRERFLGFLDVTEDGPEKAVNKLLGHFMEDIESSEKIISQSYDGALSTAGQCVQVTETLPGALLIHCFAHRIDVILSQSLAQIRECKVFFSVLSGIADFFLKSPERTHALNLIVEERLPKVESAQWNCSEKLVQIVYEYRLPLIELFEDILDNGCDWDTLKSSKIYLEYLKNDSSFNFLLTIFSEIFPFCDDSFAILQTRMGDEGFCKEKADEFKNFINLKKDYFAAVWEKTVVEEDNEPKRKHKKTDTVGDVKTPSPRLLFEVIDRISAQINKRLEGFENLEFLKLCNFSEFENKPFPESAFQSLLRHYGRYFDNLALHAELTVIYANMNTNTKNTACDLLQFLNQMGVDKDYFEVVKLCELVLTIPLINSSEEHGFPVLRRIHNFVKSSTSEGVRDLSMLSVEKDLIKELSAYPNFYDNVMEEFAKNDKQIELHYKFNFLK